MTAEDTPVPEDDAIAHAARHALGALAGTAAIAEPSWAAVEASARHAQRRRLSVLGAVMALIVVGAGTAVAEVANRGGRDVHVAGAGPGSSTEPSSEPTTDAPYNSSSAPSITTGGTVVTGPGGTAGPSTTVGTLPSDAPQLGDVTGTLTVHWSELHAVRLGSSVQIDTTIRNTSDHTIWASDASVPTSYALVCSTESSDPIHALWWMTNISLAPGATDGRTATFTPTAAYIGKVECELDLVWTHEQGGTYDTSAGGDAAQTTVIGRVPGVPLTTFAVYAPPGASSSGSSTTFPSGGAAITTPTS